jgi:lactate dehydrogenase-like 2-hydroxyacid dehydrogenase
MMGTKVTGKVLGLVGMGRIAQAVAQKSHFGFDMRIIYFDPYFKNEKIKEKFSAKSCNSIDELLSEADFVSLHCPSTPETQGLINNDKLKKMKRSAYLINTARGDIVVEDDLVSALRNNLIQGAGLDVFLNEPKVPEGLRNLTNVFLLPHLGSATEETREAMGMRVYNNVTSFFDGKEPTDRVV